MADILKKEQLSAQVYRYRLSAPRIARKRKAGQFVILRPVQDSERIPLTIADSNPDEGWIEIIFQVVGKTTMILSEAAIGSSVLDLAGPLGNPTHIEKFGKVLASGEECVAPLYPIIKALHQAGNQVVSIIGARSKDLIILEQEIRQVSDSVFITTMMDLTGTRDLFLMFSTN